MTRRLITLLAGAAALGAAVPTHGMVDRSIAAISIRPLPDAGSASHAVDVFGLVEIENDSLAAPLDVSFAIEIEALPGGAGGGAHVSLHEFDVIANPPGPACDDLDCGPGEICICTASIPPICECGPAIVQVASVEIDLEPGAVVTARLVADPLGAPDADPGNDQRSHVFDGTPQQWNRRITAAQHVPSPGGPGAIVVEVETSATYDGQLALRGQLQVHFDGVVVGTAPYEDTLTWASCDGCTGAPCAWAGPGGVAGSCVPISLDHCGCLAPPTAVTIDWVSLGAGILLSVPETLEVRLVPAPGGLPELPGFDDDDAREIANPFHCPADCGDPADGIVGIADLLRLLAEWGRPGDCDADGNGVVGIGDLLALLAAWGPCPVPAT